MVKRQIIHIDEEKCNGCGDCVTTCQEGAIQIIDGKAKVVNEKFCDGFGDCIGECPTGALTIEEKETEEFYLEATKEHVKNLRGEEAVNKMLAAQKAHQESSHNDQTSPGQHSGCPGSKMIFNQSPKNQQTNNKTSDNNRNKEKNNYNNIGSELQQWPVQIHLLSPAAPYFQNADLMVTADCVPVACGNFQELLKDNIIALGCPKLDNSEQYIDKLTQIIETNNLNSVTVYKMEVPCCSFLVKIVEKALENANSDLNLQVKTISIEGKILE